MSTTPQLAITHILQSQAQKEVTANAALDALDNGANRALLLDLGDADLTLVADQANRNGLIIFTGTTPTFIAAAAVALEIGDELTVVAPAGVDVGLADIAVTVAGSLTQ